MRSIFVSNIWKSKQQNRKIVLSGIIYVLYTIISAVLSHMTAVMQLTSPL